MSNVKSSEMILYNAPPESGHSDGVETIVHAKGNDLGRGLSTVSAFVSKNRSRSSGLRHRLHDDPST